MTPGLVVLAGGNHVSLHPVQNREMNLHSTREAYCLLVDYLLVLLWCSLRVCVEATSASLHKILCA